MIPRDKRPLLAEWRKWQTHRATAMQVTAWWRRWPTANIGIICGAISGLVVVDLDGEEGFAHLEKFPETARVKTAHGLHLYYQHPGGTVANSVKTVGLGIDIRGDGGYVLGVPSVHPTGTIYTWDPEWTGDLPMLPDWILMVEPVGEARTKEKRSKTPGEAAGSNLIPDGQRRDYLWKLGRSRRQLGAGPGVIEDMLRLENLERCDPPLLEDELKKLIREVIERPDRPPK